MGRGLWVAAIALAVGMGARVEAEDPAVSEAVLGALAELGVEPEAVRVRDVDFWTRFEPTLREKGRLLEGARLPSERDPLRPKLVDDALRSPLAAVALGLSFQRRQPAEPLWSLTGSEARLGVTLEPGSDPIPADADVPAFVRVLAMRLASLEDAFVAMQPAGEPEARMRAWMLDGPDSADVPAARAAFDRFADFDPIPVTRQMVGLLHEVRRLSKAGKGFPRGKPSHIETERGLVVLGTPKQDEHTADAWLLVDPGGHDVYRNNAGGTGTTLRAALCLDLAGNDRYESERPFVQGAALEGIGMLFDLAGNDTYRAGTFCQGAGLGGVGLLADDVGNDAFEASEFAQGAAAFGYGLLYGGRGNDTYALDRLGQGLGRTKGYGVLRDRAGNDRYVARTTHESMYSKWTGGRTVHWSFAQGCGFGFYARYSQELPDGSENLVIHDLFPGGVGVVFDLEGDDVYEGSMYAQGTAYFYGLGICVDLRGDDRYTSTWYGQGAAPHFACGILVDGAGDDVYRGMHQVQGNGRDFSTAVFLDLAGDDVYEAEDRVQGCGDINDAYGIFVDAAGRDRYVARRKAARGWATAVKPDQQPKESRPYADWGVFLDLGGGEDVYEGKAAGANDETWIQEANRRGIGIDR